MKFRSDKDNLCLIEREEPLLYDLRVPRVYYVCSPRRWLRLFLESAERERKCELETWPHLAKYYSKIPLSEDYRYKKEIKRLRKFQAKCKYYKQRSGGGCEFGDESSEVCEGSSARINAHFNEVYEDL